MKEVVSLYRATPSSHLSPNFETTQPIPWQQCQGIFLVVYQMVALPP